MRDVSLTLRICFGSCIVLIFTNQASLSVNSGVHSPLHPNFHHQFVHTSFNLDIYNPPLYQQYIQNGKFESDLVFIESSIAEPNDLISYTKDLYYENLA